MIRPNNPAVDVEALRAKVQARADSLRASGVVEERRRNPRSLAERYRAALSYVYRASHFAYPETQLPQRVKILRRFGPMPAQLALRAYNFVFRRAREASAAQSEALRELAEAGLETTRRLAELEMQIALLRDAVERRNNERR